MNVGDRIKKKRLELGLSVDEVAQRLGKNRATIYRYESNEIENLPTTVLEPLAKILDTTPAYLMGWIGEQSTHRPRLWYDFDYIVKNELPYSIMIISGICKTQRINSELTEKYIARKSNLELSEYIKFEEGINIGCDKIKTILSVLRIELKYMEVILDEFCVSYDIFMEMNTSENIIKRVALSVSKMTVSELESEYNIFWRKTKENSSNIHTPVDQSTDVVPPSEDT